METEQKVIVEPAGKTEADWSSAARSSTELPEFVEGEFGRMIELREEPAEDPGSEAAAEEAPAEVAEAEVGAGGRQVGDASEAGRPADLESAAAAQLRSHMTALLEAGGRAGGRRAAAEDSSGLIQRIAARLPGN